MNAFHLTPNYCLDRKFLRTCTIYRLLKSGRIDKAGALALQNHRYAAPDAITGHAFPPQNYLAPTISIWLSGPLSERNRAAPQTKA